MLIFVLDISSSMGGSFIDSAGTTSKVDATTSVLLQSIRGLNADTPLAVITFNDYATAIFQGLASQIEQISAILGALEATGGTDAPLALSFAGKLVDSTDQIVLITDGDLDWVLTREIIAALASRGVRVDIVQIGTSEVPVPYSDATMHVSAGSASELSEAVLRATAPAMAAAAPEEVCFTAFHPDRVRPQQWYKLWFVAHVPEALPDELKQASEEALESGLSVGMTSSAPTRVPEGTVIRVEPRGHHLEFDVVALEFRWMSSSSRHHMRFRALGEDIKETSITLDVSVRGASIATLLLHIAITSPDDASGSERRCSTRMFDAIFASHSSLDRNIVDAFKDIYRSLGIKLLIDKEELRAGDDYKPKLEQMIARSDLFQLFWSNSAAKSKWVQWEWKYALSLSGPATPKGESFIRPLVWEVSCPPLPGELNHIHYIEAPWIQLYRLHGEARGRPSGPERTAQAAPAVGYVPESASGGEPAMPEVVDVFTPEPAPPKVVDLLTPQQCRQYRGIDGLIGSRIVAADGTFLGNIVLDTADIDSINNPDSKYGSPWSRVSVWGSGPYGGKEGEFSPRNRTVTPPSIYLNDTFVGWLSSEEGALHYHIDVLRLWLERKGAL